MKEYCRFIRFTFFHSYQKQENLVLNFPSVLTYNRRIALVDEGIHYILITYVTFTLTSYRV